jgi:hypothetical protein
MIWRAFMSENSTASSRLGWDSARTKRCSLVPEGKSFSMVPDVWYWPPDW